ncbi:MAG: response regulator [Candidatus Rokubacteria bacterium]|nr:response regulator [Candidatus Rokubacteria bacterium]
MTSTTILVADDHRPILELVRFTLEADGVTVLEAANGVEALAMARAARPDLVLLDVHMPGLDGLAVCRQLRADPELSDTPIILLTAAAQESDRLRGRAAGADEYLTKPFSPLALLKLVRALLPEAPVWPGM